eukprot:TRINITY_DN4361_c0_g1_i1.p1 TRINITY_DN4361_c0_g1~~TRINITY_DN4361_c0_g1_i1.p1  ORF type:complete len:3468 (+),score=1121.67 TRINITY_DN4361_c0_g1_i1:47-10450(+)
MFRKVRTLLGGKDAHGGTEGQSSTPGTASPSIAPSHPALRRGLSSSLLPITPTLANTSSSAEDDLNSGVPYDAARWALLLDPKVAVTVHKLKVLWADYTSARTDKEKVYKLNKVLPIYIKLVETKQLAPGPQYAEIFGSPRLLASAVSRRLVVVLKDALMNPNMHSREQTGRLLLALLATSGGDASAYELLYTLELLQFDPPSVEAMAEEGLPSVMVKAFHVLFAVPAPVHESVKVRLDVRIGRVLNEQASHRAGVHDLVISDTLDLLFKLIVVDCSGIPLRRYRHRALDVAFPCVTSSVNETTFYLSQKNVFEGLVFGLTNFSNFAPGSVVSVCHLMVTMVRASLASSPLLYEDFSRSDCYTFLLHTLLRLEGIQDRKESVALVGRLLDIIVEFISVGPQPLPLPDTVNQPFTSPHIPGITSMSPSMEAGLGGLGMHVNMNMSTSQVSKDLLDVDSAPGVGVCVRNLAAFKILPDFFVAARESSSRVMLMDRLLAIYAAHPLNFVLLQHLHTLAHFIENFETYTEEVKDALLRVIVFLVTVLSIVPFQELSSLSCLLQDNPSSTSVVLIFQTVTKLVNFDQNYKAIFREAGMLDMLIKLLQKSHNVMADHTGTADTSALLSIESYTVIMDCIALLTEDQVDNIKIVREWGCVDVLLSLVHHVPTRPGALRVLQQMIKHDPEQVHGDLAALMGLLQTPAPATSPNKTGVWAMKRDVLNTLRRLFLAQKETKDAFRENGGFVSIISVLVSIEEGNPETALLHRPATTKETEAGRGRAMHDQEAEAQERQQLLDALFKATTAAIAGNPLNNQFFEEQIGFATFASGLKMTGIMTTRYAPRMLDCLFDMAYENISFGEVYNDRAQLQHPGAVVIILEVLPLTPHELHLDIFKRLCSMAESNRHNQEALSRLGIPQFILKNFHEILTESDPDVTSDTSSLQTQLLRLIQTVGANCLSPLEMRMFMKLLKPHDASPLLLHTLREMTHAAVVPPYIEFDSSKHGCAYLHYASLGDRSWPPANGYTLMFWLYIEKAGMDMIPMEIVTISTEDRRSVSSLTVRAGTMSMQTSSSTKVEFPGVRFDEGQWYHVALVHARGRFRGSEARLFVDGFAKWSGKAHYLNAGIGQVSVDVGSSTKRSAHDQIFRIGPLYLVEDLFTPTTINTLYNLGPSYIANFQGWLAPYQTYEIITADNLAQIKELDYGTLMGSLNLGATAPLNVPEEHVTLALHAYNLRPIPAGVQGIAEDPSGQYILNSADITGRSRGEIVGGVEAFAINNVATVMRKVGGISVALLLIEHAETSSALEDSACILIRIIQNNPKNTWEMGHMMRGYWILGWLLRRKAGLLTAPIAALLLELVGIHVNPSTPFPLENDPTTPAPTPSTAPHPLGVAASWPNITWTTANPSPSSSTPTTSSTLGTPSTSTPPHTPATTPRDHDHLFHSHSMTSLSVLALAPTYRPKHATAANAHAIRPLFFSFEIWRATPSDLQMFVLRSLRELVVLSNPAHMFNSYVLRKQHAISDVIHMLKDETIAEAVWPSIIGLLEAIMMVRVAEEDVRLLSSFLVSSLHPGEEYSSSRGTSRRRRNTGAPTPATDRDMRICNLILELLVRLIMAAPGRAIFFKMISSNWLFFFLDDSLPATTVNIGLRVLCALCQGKSQSFHQKFKTVGGFKELERILPAFCNNAEIYYTLISLLLGKSVLELPSDKERDMRIDYPELLSTFRSSDPHVHCVDAAHVMLAMLKRSYEESYEPVPSMGSSRPASPTMSHPADVPASPSQGANVFDEELPPSLSSVLSTSVPSLVGSPGAVALGHLMGKVAHSAVNTAGTIRKLGAGVLGNESMANSLSQSDGFDDNTSVLLSPPDMEDDSISSVTRSLDFSSLSSSFAEVAEGNTPREAPSPLDGKGKGRPGMVRSISTTGLPGIVKVDSTQFSQAPKTQHNVLKFLMHLFEVCADFQGACTQTELLEYLVSVVFPNGSLNISEPARDDRPVPPTSPSLVTFSSSYTPTINPNNNNSNNAFGPVLPDTTVTLVFMLICRIVEQAIKSSSKAITVVETATEASPLNAPGAQAVMYMTRVLSDAMHAMEASVSSRSDFFENERLANNLGKFCTMLVEYVQAGMFLYGGRPVFHFILSLLYKIEGEGHRENKSIRSLDLQLIYKALNRSIIFLLSQPAQTDTPFQDPKYIILAIVQYQKIILGPNNVDHDFVPCLCYYLYRFTLADDAHSREGALTIWRLLLSLKVDALDSLLIVRTAKGEVLDIKNKGFDRLFQRDYNDFSYWLGNNIGLVQQVFDETLKRAWNASVLAERRAAEDVKRHVRDRRAQRVSRRERRVRLEGAHHDKVDGYKTRASNIIRTAELGHHKKKRQGELDRAKYVATTWQGLKTQLIRERGVWGADEPSGLDKYKLDPTEGPYRMRKKMELNGTFYKDYPYAPAEMRSDDPKKIPPPMSEDSEAYYRLNGVMNIDDELSILTSSSVAGSSISTSSNSSNSASKRASAEIRREDFFNSPARSYTSSPLGLGGSGDNESPSGSVESSPLSSAEPSPVLSRAHVSASPSDRMFSDATGDADDRDDTSMGGSGSGKSTPVLGADGSTADFDKEDWEVIEDETRQQQQDAAGVNKDATGDDDEDDDEQKDQKILRLLQPGDHIQNIFNCGSVDGMDKADGIFLFCTSNIYVIDGYARDSNGEIIELEEKINTDWVVEGHTPVRPTRMLAAHNLRRWSYEDIREILRRRYLLRPVAIEMFSTDGRNHLVVFDDLPGREEVFRLLGSLISASPTGGEGSAISGAQLGDEYASGSVRDRLLTTVWKREPPTALWQQGKISNLQYLMHLNTLAGRSYNDLTQYPVFPWVLKDYTSDELDLTDLSVFRDLSKPMGALTENRAEKFRERYDMWDPDGDEASIMGVGPPRDDGRPPHVPKFHYGTHYSSAAIVLYFLIRLEPFTHHFLKLQGGRWDQPDRLFHSLAETWYACSEGSTGSVMELVPEFYYLPDFLENRNKFNLGEKQAGSPIDDVVLPPWAHGSTREFIKKHRQALESPYVSEHLHEWIDLVFGYKQQGKPAEEALNVFYYLTYEGAVDIEQITDPVQKAATLAQINNFGQTPKQLFDKPHPKRVPVTYPTPFYAHQPVFSSLNKELGEPVGQIRIVGDKVITAGPQRALLAPNFTKQIAWGLSDMSMRVLSNDKIVEILENMHDGHTTCMGVTEDGRIAVSGGQDTLVNVYSYQKGDRDRNSKQFQLIKRLCGHTATVTCVAASRPYSIIVSGSEDRTCIIWDLNRLAYVRSLGLGMHVGDGPITNVAVHDVTGDIVSICGTTVSIWTVNGEVLVSCRTSLVSSENITCCLWGKGPEWQGENVLIVGQRDGKIKVWQIDARTPQDDVTNASVSTSFSSSSIPPHTSYSLHLKTTLPANFHHAPITALQLSADQQRLFSGDAEGKIVCWSEVDLSSSRQRGWTINASDIRQMLQPSLPLPGLGLKK